MSQDYTDTFLGASTKRCKYAWLKHLFSAGKFWRQRPCPGLSNQTQQPVNAPIIVGQDNILYPTHPQNNEGTNTRPDQQANTMQDLHWLLKRYCQPGSLAIDVGATVGYLSAYMAHCVGSEGMVWAFEANPQSIDKLEKVFWLNRWQHFQIFPFALSDMQGEMKLSLPSSDQAGNESKQSMMTTLQVPCQTLDSLMIQVTRPVSLMLIQTGDNALALLRGARDFLQRFKPALLFATGVYPADTASEIQALLTDSTYRIVGIVQKWGLQPVDTLCSLNQNFSPTSGQANQPIQYILALAL